MKEYMRNLVTAASVPLIFLSYGPSKADSIKRVNINEDVRAVAEWVKSEPDAVAMDSIVEDIYSRYHMKYLKKVENGPNTLYVIYRDDDAREIGLSADGIFGKNDRLEIIIMRDEWTKGIFGEGPLMKFSRNRGYFEDQDLNMIKEGDIACGGTPNDLATPILEPVMKLKELIDNT